MRSTSLNAVLAISVLAFSQKTWLNILDKTLWFAVGLTRPEVVTVALTAVMKVDKLLTWALHPANALNND